MPEDSRRGVPQATRLMVAVFDAISACADLIHYWDVGKRPEGGVLVRVSSQGRYGAEDAAAAAAREIASRLQPGGYETQVLTALGRLDGHPDAGWQAFVEVLVE